MDTKRFDEMLYMDDPDFAKKLRAVIGAAPGEIIEFVTPQFGRSDGRKIEVQAAHVINNVAKMPKATLTELGLQQWGEFGLWLFPAEWYPHIPEGMELMCIDGEVGAFEAGVTDDDMRCGALAYGIVPDFEVRSK